MSAVSYFWTDGSFRLAVRRLVSLTSDQLMALTEMTRSGFELARTDLDRLQLSESEATQVIGALRTIYRSGRDSDYTSERSLSEVESLIEASAEEFTGVSITEKRNVLLELFAPRPEHDKEQARQAIQSGPLPVLTNVSFYVDLRALADEGKSSSGKVGFVPVVLARFFTDEPDKGITLQLTKNSLESLKTGLEGAEKLLKAVENQAGESLY